MLDSPGTFLRGRPDAPITIVEFSDLQCPFCQKFLMETYPTLKARYIDTGIVQFYSRDFPLANHTLARAAAVATRCAFEQGRYWELRTALLENARRLSPTSIDEQATALRLDLRHLRQCISSRRFDDAVQQDIDTGVSLNVNATPTFVIGRSGEPFIGEMLVGAHPAAAFIASTAALKESGSLRRQLCA